MNECTPALVVQRVLPTIAAGCMLATWAGHSKLLDAEHCAASVSSCTKLTIVRYKVYVNVRMRSPIVQCMLECASFAQLAQPAERMQSTTDDEPSNACTNQW